MNRRRQWQPTPVLLPGKSHGQRSLVGCHVWGHEESDTTEWLHFHFSLSCVGEGNGNLLQCSCLENPRDGGAWWAAVYGVSQSWTRLIRLSSSSSSSSIYNLILKNAILKLCDIEWINQMFTYSVSEKILQENLWIFYWLEMLKVSVTIKMFHHFNSFISK